MPKVSVYLPDGLYQDARARGLPISSLAQRAIEEALRAGGTDRWVERVRARPRRVEGEVDTAAALAEVRDQFGT